jgi:DNA-binding CsgD family transcriptional regulator
MVDTARAARLAPPPPGSGRPQDLFLDAVAILHTDGAAAAAPILREALTAFRAAELSPDAAWWFGYSLHAALLLWDDDAFYALAARFLHAARDLGALTMLAWALDSFAVVHIWRGELTTAASLIGEAQSVIEATGSNSIVFAPTMLEAWRGREAEAKSAAATAIEQARARSQGSVIKVAQSAMAALCNGLGQYEEALIAAEKADSGPRHNSSHVGELIEAAVRSGRRALAAEAVERLAETTGPSGTAWGLGIEARSRALVSTGDAAEVLYLEAIERLDRSPVRSEAARAHLLYGEWLRRESRRVDAREQLRTAYGELSEMGMEAFAERARRELAATGETVRRRTVETLTDLTPQEAQIARLAAEGKTNPDIGAQLFISARTVEYHLRKVFTKLNISSRKELSAKLQRSGHPGNGT